MNLKLACIGILLLVIGLMGGWLGFLFFGDMAKSVQVVFVSEESLINLEKERIKNLGKESVSGGSTQSIFFGKSDIAIKKMEQIAKSFENRRTKVLYVSNKKGLARNGTEISNIVHKELVKVLSAEKKA
jgi:hypothetical protein